MNGELLSVLDHLERDKGISREVLLQAIQAALVSAARKTLGHAEEEGDITASIDPLTGKIQIIADGKELPPDECGRIAAQSARQVMIQKIREAERDVVYGEFIGKVGQLVNGIIQRFERGDLLIDLGRTEGVLPRREQSAREEYRTGDRLRAYVLEVEKSARGTQIILSRTHHGLLRKLLELEVPEIYEGIVEVKAISREAGDRSKVAVVSKDERVDPVGACVGMRGNRIKNIVRELQGEKIDIIRWNEDAREFIKESLGPAQVMEIVTHRQEKRAEVIVADDQLSLAIGKRGQNVRLASKLTGFSLDIRTPAQVAERRALSLEALPGIGPKTAEALKEAGFLTVEAVARAGVEGLMQAKGVGEKTAAKLVEDAQAAIAAAEERAAAKQRQLEQSFGEPGGGSSGVEAPAA